MFSFDALNSKGEAGPQPTPEWKKAMLKKKQEKALQEQEDEKVHTLALL